MGTKKVLTQKKLQRRQDCKNPLNSRFSEHWLYNLKRTFLCLTETLVAEESGCAKGFGQPYLPFLLF